MDIKVATFNFCLRLQAKKNLFKETILYENIDILCMQGTEINKNFDHNLLSFPNYSIETECWYLNNKIDMDWLNLTAGTFKVKFIKLFM